MLTLHDAEVTYPNGTAALRRTTLRVEAGAFTVLLGASGAGKSTLLRVMNGPVAPTRGVVVHDRLGTLDSAARWRAHRRACGMVFQQHHLIGRVSVLGNVLLGRVGAHSTLRTLWPLPRADRIAAAVVSLHQVALAQRFADRVVGLAGGRVVFDGAAAALSDGALESLYGGASRRPPETRPMELSDEPTLASA